MRMCFAIFTPRPSENCSLLTKLYPHLPTGPEVISVITNDGRNLVGNLRGFDQTTNLILDECHERVFSPDAGVEQHVLGLYIIRGDNM